MGKPLRLSRCICLTAVPAAILVAAIYGYCALFMSFQPYDDEGTCMISVSTFAEGQPLYAQAYSQYGPFYSLYMSLLYRVCGTGVTNDAARWITLVHWIMASLGCAWFVYSVTRSPVAAGGVFFLAVWHLRPLTMEPGVPHGVLVMLICLTPAAATWARSQRWSPWAWFVLGAFAAATVLVKINIGVYLLLALLFSLSRFVSPARFLRSGRFLLGLFIVLMPALVMRAHAMPGGWAFNYCALVTISLTAMLLAGSRTQPSRTFPLGTAGVAACGFGSVIVSVLATMLIRGTTPWDLLNGIILRPLQHPGVFFYEYRVPVYGLLCAGASLGLAVWTYFRESSVVWESRYLGWARLGLGLFGTYEVLLGGCTELTAVLGPFMWLLWAFGPDPSERISPEAFPRMLAGSAAVLQILHAYPVAGSHVHWATILFVPVTGIMLWDGWRSIRAANPQLSRMGAGLLNHPAMEPVWLLGIVAAFGFWVNLPACLARYEQRVSLGLPGAERIRLEAETVAAYSLLTNNLRTYADTFAALPGFNSFYFWTGLTPPTSANVGDWMTLLSDEEQTAVVDALKRSGRVCSIYNPEAVGFWLRGQDIRQKPLVRYLLDEFYTVFQVGRFEKTPFEFRMRNDGTTPFTYISLLAGERYFPPGTDPLPLPRGLIANTSPFTLSIWFRTASPGVLLGLQSEPYPSLSQAIWLDALSVNPDGRLTGALSTQGPRSPVQSNDPVNDNLWHHAAIVHDGRTAVVYLDGHRAGEQAVETTEQPLPCAQLGGGFQPQDNRKGDPWLRFHGALADAVLFTRPLGIGDIERLRQRPAP